MFEPSTQPTSHDERARHFLERYQELTDPEHLVSELFAPEVLVEDPTSSQRIPKRFLAKGMAQRESEFRAAGLSGTKLSGWSTQRLDADVLLVATSWRLTFVHPERGTEQLELKSDYLLRQQGEGMTCVAYRARQDVAAELERRGLR